MVEAASVLNVANELDEIQLIRFVKAGQGGAVDIQNADDMPILMIGTTILALRCTVARNVTGEGVYIADTLNRARLQPLFRIRRVQSGCAYAGSPQKGASVAHRHPSGKNRTS